MKKIRLALIIFLILLIAIPLFGQRRRRRRGRMTVSPLTLSFYGGIEDLMDSTRYFSGGGDAILPIVTPIMLRVNFLRVEFLHGGGNRINFGTGFGGDIMYYWQMPMTFTPYGFGGLYYGSVSDEISSSSLTLHLGLGGQMRGFYNLFIEGGMDYQQTKIDTLTTSDTPMFIHAGLRFPLFK